jgi:hypothetical protein
MISINDIFFSAAGDANNPGQLELLKSANSYVLNNFVKPAPVGGDGTHFYKTINPPTNFGPYTREQVDNAIDSSGLFISYIGHSGTETWDNGITEVVDLKPAFNDRLSLISDFGCSTGKFAEPNVVLSVNYLFPVLQTVRQLLILEIPALDMYQLLLIIRSFLSKSFTRFTCLLFLKFIIWQTSAA